MEKRLNHSFFTGFAIATLVLLLAFGLYTAQSGTAQTSGNLYQGQEIVNDVNGSENAFTVIAASVGDIFTGTNSQPGGESLEISDAPGVTLQEAFIRPEGYEDNRANMISEPEVSSGIEGITTTLTSLVIPAADFVNDGMDPDGPFFYFEAGAWLGATTPTCFVAPAYLPDNVTLAEFWGTFDDTDATYQGEMRLFRRSNFGGTTSELMATVASGSTFNAGYTNPGDTSIEFPLVANPEYSYFVGGCLESALIKFIGVRLYYLP